MKIRILLACSLLLSSIGNVYATAYTLPAMRGDTVIAQFPNEDSHLITVAREDFPEVEANLPITLLDVAKRYGLGQEEVVRLNPTVDRWLVKPGEMVRIPNKRILPDTPRNGVTLNISEFRMYYYPPNGGQVMTYAHGIGRQDWKTPLGKTKVIRKVKNPTWNPPASIRREHAADGDPLPAVVPPGPHNPLGTRALYLSLPGEYRIHGTDIDKVYGIGMQITHGCVRMYPDDIEELYDLIPVGTPVYLVKQPIKVGWLNNVLYIEAHPDLEGENMGKERRYQVALNLISKANGQSLPEFDQKALNDALEKLDGEPVALYERLPPLDGGTAFVPTDVPDSSQELPATVNPEQLSPEPEPEPVAPQQSVPEPMTKAKPATKTGTQVAAKPKAAAKTEVKVATKPAVKTDAKVAAKPAPKATATKVAVKPAAKPDTKVAAKPVPKTNAKVAVKPVPKANANAKVAAKPVPKADVKVAVKPAPKADVKVAAKPAPKTNAKVAVKPAPKSNTNVAVKPKPETKLAVPKTAAKFTPKPLASL